MLVGTPLRFQVAVSGASTEPTGAVTLLDAQTPLAQQTLDATGAASFALSTLSAGTHTLTASYSGDANYSAASSTSLVQAVTDFQVAVTPDAQTVSPGGNATYSLAITSSPGLNASVTVVCSGLPAYATCSMPTPVSITGGAPANTNVIVTTKAPGAAALAVGTTALYAIMMFGGICLYTPPSRRKLLARALPGLCSLTILLVVSGCSGGSGSGSSPQPAPGTPVGTSSVTIAVTATQNGTTSVHSTMVTLIVH